MFKVQSKSRKILESDIVEFIQGVAGYGVPRMRTNEYRIVLEGKDTLDKTVSITEMSEAATKNMFEQMNEMVFSKFSRTIDVKGRSIYVSEII